MGVNISYMGTKKELAPAVNDVIRQAQPGVLLDAFAGMCSVGEQVAPARQVWGNDIQVFASEIARALFISSDEPPSAMRMADLHFEAFYNHQIKLKSDFTKSVEVEDKALRASDFGTFSRSQRILSTTLKSERSVIKRRRDNLFATTYSHNYFGVHQAIDADAIIKAIRIAHKNGHTSVDQKRWLMIALGRALLKIANSTGHFAQFLKPNQTSYKRYISQRRRNLWGEWLFSIGELTAIGTIDWRRHNKVFNEDSLTLLPVLATSSERPSVIYADPPYTDDQYSRYYHILDTLMLYDYPATTGAGLYRPDRFTTPFSLKSRAVHAFEDFISLSSKTGADLVLSYPTNGLIHEIGSDPLSLLCKHYRKVERCYELPHQHSTFGASKGRAHAQVVEVIYLAKL